MAKIRRFRRFALFVLGLVIIVIIGAYGAKRLKGRVNSKAAADSSADSAQVAEKKSKDEKGEEVEPIPVEIAIASIRSISSYYRTTASLRPEKQVDVVAKIGGEIGAIMVEEGSLVKKGDLLCKLNDEEQRISLEEARINQEKEEREYERIRAMHEQKLVSDKEYTDIKYQYEVAENRYEAARLRYNYTRIRAPFGGVITKRFIDTGENVTLGMKLFELADIDPLLIHMYLPENEVATVHSGQVIFLTADSDPGEIFAGKIVRCSPEVDDKTGTVKVTAEIEGRAMPGSFVRIKIVTDTHHQSLAIPRRGLVNDAGEIYVYLAEADTVRKASVEIGYRDENFAEVLNGIELSDSVVVLGQGGLKTGAKIKILTPHEQSNVSKADSQSDSS